MVGAVEQGPDEGDLPIREEALSSGRRGWSGGDGGGSCRGEVVAVEVVGW